MQDIANQYLQDQVHGSSVSDINNSEIRVYTWSEGGFNWATASSPTRRLDEQQSPLHLYRTHHSLVLGMSLRFPQLLLAVSKLTVVAIWAAPVISDRDTPLCLRHTPSTTPTISMHAAQATVTHLVATRPYLLPLCSYRITSSTADLLYCSRGLAGHCHGSLAICGCNLVTSDLRPR